jgi:hypothetical protein
MKLKPLCLVLPVLLLFQFSLLYCGDLPPMWNDGYWREDSAGFFEYLSVNDYRNHRIGFVEYQEDSPGDYSKLPWISGRLDLLQGVLKTPPRKDPFIAGLLSWFMMGVGQIYVHEYTKGSVFIAVDLTNKVLLLLLISHINSKYSPDSDEIVNVDWNSFDSGTKFFIIAYLTESLGVRIFSVVDAVQSAQQYNERFSNQKDETGFAFNLKGDEISIGYNFWLSD